MVTTELDADGVIAALAGVEADLDPLLHGVMTLAGDMIVAEAKTTHDYVDRSSALTNSIGPAEVSGTWRGGNLAVEVAAGAPHASAIEFGAKPHLIRPKKRKALRWPVEGGFRFARVVRHPGNKPYRYLRNALEAKLPVIVLEVQAAVDLAFLRRGLG